LPESEALVERNVAAAAVFVAVVILFFSLFTITVQGENIYPPFAQQDTTQQFALSTPLVLGISFQEKAYLNQTTRAGIFGLIQEQPGLHFRGVCDSLALSIGVVQYHLGVLVSAGLVSVYSDGKMQRFFEAGKYTPKKMKLVSLLRHKTIRAILNTLKSKESMTHGELAAQLSITSQGLTWQMNKLKKAGIVQETSNGLRLNYCMDKADAQLVTELDDLVRIP
jgi:predicted transcriptional regulator